MRIYTHFYVLCRRVAFAFATSRRINLAEEPVDQSSVVCFKPSDKELRRLRLVQVYFIFLHICTYVTLSLIKKTQ